MPAVGGPRSPPDGEKGEGGYWPTPLQSTDLWVGGLVSVPGLGGKTKAGSLAAKMRAKV